MHLFRKCEGRLVFTLLPLLINPMCTVIFYLAAWLESPAAGRWAWEEKQKLCVELIRGFCSSLTFPGASAPWHLPVRLNLGLSRNDAKRSKEGEVGKQGRKWETGTQMGKRGRRAGGLWPQCWVDAGSCSHGWCLHQRAKSLELLQGKTSFSLLNAKKLCLASSTILSHPWQAGFGAGGRAGDGKIPVPCVAHPRLHPFRSSHWWPLSVMRWEDWARRQLQCHPVHPHIILTYYIVINWTIPLHYFIFEEIYRLSWWLKRQWLKEQCANEWASAQSLFN